MAKAKQQIDWQNRIVEYGQQPAGQFLAHELNARRHPGEQREALRGSLNAVGWIAPVIVSKRTGKLLDGHARIEEALTKDESALVPFVSVDVDEAEEALILGTFDPITNQATYDREALDGLLRQIETSESGLQQLLADLAAKNDLYLTDDAAKPSAGGDDFDTTPEETQTRVQYGDLWQCGEHRVLCGDSTKADDVAKVMNGEKADAVLTDPPYGINQEGVTNDEPEKLAGLVKDSIGQLPINQGVIVAFQSTRTFPLWLDEIRAAGFHFERMLWLYKEAQCTFPWRGWILTSESILVATKGQGRWSEVNPYSHDCYKVSEVSGEIPDGLGWHGSVKPLAVVVDIAARITQEGDVVYEPFGGSGTTLIACERTNRKARVIEIEPKYVNVILSRWEAETGREAKLLERIDG